MDELLSIIDFNYDCFYIVVSTNRASYGGLDSSSQPTCPLPRRGDDDSYDDDDSDDDDDGDDDDDSDSDDDNDGYDDSDDSDVANEC